MMIGGTGNNSYWVDNTHDIVKENAGGGTWDNVYASVSHTLGANVENLTLTGSAAIYGKGNGLDNHIFGNSGNNTLVGYGGDDRLFGGAGADTMIGGIGNDEYGVDQGGDVVTENADEGTDSVRSKINYTLGANVEILFLDAAGGAINGAGNSLDNGIGGNAASNILMGLGGDDDLDGGGGADTMIGESATTTTGSTRAATRHRKCRRGYRSRLFVGQPHARRQCRAPGPDRCGIDQRHRQRTRQHHGRQRERQHPDGSRRR